MQLWTDVTAFRAAVRTVVAVAGVVLTQVPDLPAWVGSLVSALAVAIPAGERNAPPS